MPDPNKLTRPNRAGRRRLPPGQRRIQVCIYLQADTLSRLDLVAGGDRQRSAYVERILEAHLSTICTR